jgi:transcriptional regulator with XRE-family HTH domain
VDLAKKSGLYRLTIAKIEHDKSVPNQSTVERLAQALGVTTNDLLSPYQAPKPIQAEHPEITQLKANVKQLEVSRLERRIADLEKEMIRGFARLEGMLQAKK